MDPRVLGRHVTTDVSDDAAAGIKCSCDKSRPVVCNGGSGRSLNHSNRASNGIQVDKGVARKAKQKPEGEMEETKTAAASEAL